ncbi:hypothetical protein Syun_029123 [Stephania yunnanensis]|uniref:Uncharacterized protein n=1 Tax=Stephania yunnanensis TaxID=152371 RepID=A0AAP0HH16_9MAGN
MPAYDEEKDQGGIYRVQGSIDATFVSDQNRSLCEQWQVGEGSESNDQCRKAIKLPPFATCEHWISMRGDAVFHKMSGRTAAIKSFHQVEDQCRKAWIQRMKSQGLLEQQCGTNIASARTDG